VLFEDDPLHLLDGRAFISLCAYLEEHLDFPLLKGGFELAPVHLALYFLQIEDGDFPVALVDELTVLVQLVNTDEAALEEDGAELFNGDCIPLAVLGNDLQERPQPQRVECTRLPVREQHFDDIDWQFPCAFVLFVALKEREEGVPERVLALDHLLDY
jgi:hypothetical protein